MKLFFDEDVGKTVARLFAEQAPDVDVEFVAVGRAIEPGTADLDWMRYAADQGYIVISQNQRQLNVEAERRTIREQRLGIVYIPADLTVESKAALLLRKRRWLDRKYRGENRPFAFYVDPFGKHHSRAIRR